MKQLKYFSLLIILILIIAGCSNEPSDEKHIPNQGKQIRQIKPNNKKLVNSNKDKNYLQQEKYLRDSNFRDKPVSDLIASYTATLPNPILYERYNINLASNYLNSAVVKPGQIFSLNNRIGRRSSQRGFKLGPMYKDYKLSYTMGGGVCKVASVLYNVSVLSNQRIIERHFHSMTVPYVPLGQDATIAYGTKDFRFQNITKHPIRIKSYSKDGNLTISFYGKYKSPKIEWKHRVKKEDSISIVSSWVVIENGSRKITKIMGISRYRPEKH